MVASTSALLLSYRITWYISIYVAKSPVPYVKVLLQKYFEHVLFPVPFILLYLSYNI
jgi:hypothetical protein